jgi:hypothetical protein
MITVTFEFEKSGLNAHKASGEFTYDTPDNAEKAAEAMRATPGFFNIKLIDKRKQTR